MGDDRPKRRSDVSFRAVDGEIIVLDRAAKQIHQLNATASFIWHRCDGQHIIADIAEELARFFDVELDPAREAVVASVRRFSELGLLDPA